MERWRILLIQHKSISKYCCGMDYMSGIRVWRRRKSWEKRIVNSLIRSFSNFLRLFYRPFSLPRYSQCAPEKAKEGTLEGGPLWEVEGHILWLIGWDIFDEKVDLIIFEYALLETVRCSSSELTRRIVSRDWILVLLSISRYGDGTRLVINCVVFSECVNWRVRMRDWLCPFVIRKLFRRRRRTV